MWSNYFVLWSMEKLMALVVVKLPFIGWRHHTTSEIECSKNYSIKNKKKWLTKITKICKYMLFMFTYLYTYYIIIGTIYDYVNKTLFSRTHNDFWDTLNNWRRTLWIRFKFNMIINYQDLKILNDPYYGKWNIWWDFINT